MESLFEFNQQYTSLDEDYANKIVIYKDGSLELYQMETSDLEPELKTIEKNPDEALAKKVSELLDQNQKAINRIPFKGKNENAEYEFKLNDKEFSLLFLNNTKNNPRHRFLFKKSRETESKAFIINLLGNIKNILEEFYPGIVNWNRIEDDFWIA